jgi:negative regulator of replication initiation
MSARDFAPFVATRWPGVKNRCKVRPMKTIDVSEEVYAALQHLAHDLHQSPDELLASLFQVPVATSATESILAFALGPALRLKINEGEKYLALLAWVAVQHGAEFGEFIRSETGSSRFLTLGREEIVESCRRNLSCQIDGTQYWAVMNIDRGTKCRFVRRLLEFVGYREATIELVTVATGLGSVRRGRFTALVA